jgi:hypothetical protein
MAIQRYGSVIRYCTTTGVPPQDVMLWLIATAQIKTL